MPTIARFIFIATILLLPTSAGGQEEKLPRALILGDSIYRQPATEAAKELQGKVQVIYITTEPGEVFNSTTALQKLDELLGEESWDVIHINCGLGDLVYRAPGMKSFRVMSREAGGVRATSPPRYESNLRELVKQLKATKAKLIWASTTPIRHSSTNVFALGSEIEYNAIATKVMEEEDVPTSDVYNYVKSLIDMEQPASHGADPFFFDRKPLHPPIVRSILHVLDPRSTPSN